jgi:hypothetical protein
MTKRRVAMTPLHLLYVIARPGGMVGAELTVHATGDCFPVVNVEVGVDPQYVETGEVSLEAAWFRHTIAVEIDTSALLLQAIPHSTLLGCSYQLPRGARATLALDWSQLDIERLYA